MAIIERIPFIECVSDDKLLGKHWKTLSMPQQVVLKAFYGLPLETDDELDTWAVFQDSAEFDRLGYPTKITRVPYEPKEYDSLVAIIGRRGGKTDKISATALAYEAVCGGHKQYVSANQDYQIYFVGQDAGMAASHLKFVEGALNSSPMLAKEIVKITEDGIFFKNKLTIVPQPPTIKSSRGMAIPVVVMDEVGFWYSDAKAANPDFEVEIAIEYAQNQFPFAKKIVTSTPWTKEGILWKAAQVGTEGQKIKCSACLRAGQWRCPHRVEEKSEYTGMLMVHAPTAAMQSPLTRKVRLERLARKPEVFKRESLAQFVDSISGFLPAALIGDAVPAKITQRPRLPRRDHPEDPSPVYIAAIDPAFRHDAFAFAIMHHDPDVGIVLDRFVRWLPEKGVPLNPSEVLDQINTTLKEFQITMVYSDQYQLESLQQLAQQRGFTIIGCDFTAQSKARIFGSFEMLVKQRRMQLLDIPELVTELTQLEKRRTPNGVIQISAPAGKYDDGACVVALCAYQAIWLITPANAAPPKPPTHIEDGLAQIQRGRQQYDEDD